MGLIVNHRLQQLEVCWRPWLHKSADGVCVITVTARGGRQTFPTVRLMLELTAFVIEKAQDMLPQIKLFHISRQ